MISLDRKIKVAITHGDTNGIGYELIFRTFAESEILELFTPIVYGNKKIMEQHAEALQMSLPFQYISDASQAVEDKVNFVSVSEPSEPVTLGKATMESELLAKKALECAIEDFSQGSFDVLVDMPCVEDDHISLLEKLSQCMRNGEGSASDVMNLRPMTMFDDGFCYAASVTGNVDASVAGASISEEGIVERVKLLRGALRRDCRLDNPRIAILSLNPQVSTDEDSPEVKVIASSVKQLVGEGVQVFGPYSAEGFFENNIEHFDGVMAIYKDQLKPFIEQCEYQNQGLMITGMPIVVTKPVQTPCLDIAGKGVANEDAMRNAIYRAIDMFRSRFFYDQPYKNPLPKMYHERKEDGEKSRFAVKKNKA